MILPFIIKKISRNKLKVRKLSKNIKNTGLDFLNNKYLFEKTF